MTTLRPGAAAAMALSFLLAGCCRPETALPAVCDDPREPTIGFVAPSGVAVVEGLVFVTNAGFTFEAGVVVYGPSEVTILDAATGAVLQRIVTAEPNAQFVTVAPGDGVNVTARVYVVSSGPSSFDGSVVLPSGPGAVERFDVRSGVPPDAASLTISIPAGGSDPRYGFPSRLAVSADGTRGIAGSGTAGIAYRIDLSAGSVTDTVELFPAPDGLNGSTEVRIVDGRTHVLGFNTDSYCVSDADDGSIDPASLRCADIGESDALLEGPLDLSMIGPDRALVVMSLANALYEVALDGALPARAAIHPLRGPRPDGCGGDAGGLAPNRIVAAGDDLFVLSSGSNNLWSFDALGGGPRLHAVLCPATNPFDVAHDLSTGRLWITGLVSQSVVILDGSSAEVLEELR